MGGEENPDWKHGEADCRMQEMKTRERERREVSAPVGMERAARPPEMSSSVTVISQAGASMNLELHIRNQRKPKPSQ